ncbi:probable xyloglucan galactosyltransferase GT19 [Triticum aestivum]|uniref:probable xyloglucan galactosyltransferase GT19 n=1 Tax=Triticum aestivum TaxID=4565 RepID=UPI001D013F95|nr:probable xyloglucan galactosyltransferase GT19 [Triticum aestivum]
MDDVPCFKPESSLNDQQTPSLQQQLAEDLQQLRRPPHLNETGAAAPMATATSPDLHSSPLRWQTLSSSSLLRRPEFDNFTFLTLESRAWPWQEHAVPHPTSFHPSSLPRLRAWIARARRSRRTALMLYAGTVSRPSRPNIRSFILAECANRTDTCTVVDCHGGSCALDPVRSMRPMLKAKFCLEPPGDTSTRRSTFDAVVAGCVPVFFEDASARTQYGWHLPPGRYEEFSVTIPKDAVMLGGVQIMETLAAVPEEEVARMRERLLELAPRVVYRRHGSAAERMREASMDAVDIAVEGALRRIRRRVRALKDGQPEAIYAMDDDDQEI